MNIKYLRSKTITPNNEKSYNKFKLNNLNLSLTKSIDNSSYIILKDGTIKQKRHKNSYLEGYLDNKILLMAMDTDTESKIRRAKSCLNYNQKKNLFYRANCWNFKTKKSNKNNSDTNMPYNLHRINMFQNVFMMIIHIVIKIKKKIKNIDLVIIIIITF